VGQKSARCFDHADDLPGVDSFAFLDQWCGGQVAVSGDGPIGVLQF
jgi:hypothetical protein